MIERFYLFLILILVSSRLFSQENNEESFRKTLKSELKVVEAKLARKRNDAALNYKYGILCFKLCKYREAQKAFYKCMDHYKNDAYFFLHFYNIEIALKENEQADQFYSNYLSLLKYPKSTLRYKVLSSEKQPDLATKNMNSIEYFPYVLENDRIKYLTISEYTYTEPTSPLLFRNYLTEDIVFADPELNRSELVKQPERSSEGFSYNVFCLTKKQDRIYMTRYDGVNKRMIICTSEKIDKDWTPFKTIHFFAKNPTYNFMHPMLTENENQLIFASDMKGGIGGLDLWVGDLTDSGDIKNVQNLGDEVNTIGNECFPTMYNQGTIFFSSDGHHGYGSLDLYKTELLGKGITSEPINLGPSFNSPRDDYSLFYSKDAKTGYFTSNRSATDAKLFMDKIYKIKLNVFDCQVLSFEIKNPFVIQEEIVAQESQIELSNPNTIPESKINSTPEKVVETYENKPSAINSITILQSESIQKAIPNSQVTNKEEKIDLYNSKNEKIEEKFVQYSDNVSITNLNSSSIIENKFWTTAKLLFKDFDIEIGYSYVRIINPKQEVVYSNYSTKNGMISVEVVEDNEYTIEIPRFKTILQGVVFSRNENNLYFPYNSESISNPKEVSTYKPTKKPRSTSTKSSSHNRSKRKYQKTKLAKIVPSAKTAKQSPIIQPSKKKTKPPKSFKKRVPEKPTPKNMIESFS